MTAISSPVLTGTPESNTVLVNNISSDTSRMEIVALFNTLIGKVRKSEGLRNSLGGPLKITFFTQDASQKALCMSGYTVGGKPLVVTSLQLPDLHRISAPVKHAETRRNLYVLGLPFTFTKSEFASTFSRFGTVSHCVILATLDNASRRRGFVVMSTNEEAKLAMSVLSRTQLNGHTLDISWAVVQRSQGFLDGGDRRMMFDSRSSQATSADGVEQDALEFHSSNVSDLSATSADGTSDDKPLTTALTPTSTLLVTNLPTFLFSQALDLHPLFYPFGKIRKLEILSTYPGHVSETMAVIVEYSKTSSAQEAKETLQGQSYSSHTLKVEYMQPKVERTTSFSDVKPDTCLGNSSNLNPFAPAFKSETAPSHPVIALFSPYHNSDIQLNSAAPPNNPFAKTQYCFVHAPSRSALVDSHFTQPDGLSSATSCWDNNSYKCYSSLRDQYAFGDLSNANLSHPNRYL